MNESAHLGAADGAGAAGAEDDFVSWEDRQKCRIRRRGRERVPNMPSFQTSLRYSDFGISIIGQYRRGWRSGNDTDRGCFSRGDLVTYTTNAEIE